jgi:hypothetical protein
MKSFEKLCYFIIILVSSIYSKAFSNTSEYNDNMSKSFALLQQKHFEEFSQLNQKNHSKKIFTIFIVLLSTVSCQESYNIDDLESSKNIIVFEGAITDEPGPYKVNIYLAKSFGSNNNITVVGVTSAKVKIKDDLGRVVELQEGNNGTYTTSKFGFRGTIGRTYQLHVTLRDDNIYESVPTKLEAADTISNLYVEPGIYATATTDAEGDYLKKTYLGLYVYADVNSNSETTKYYKFDNLVIRQYTRVKYPGSPVSFLVFFRQLIKPDNLPITKASIFTENKQIVKKQKLLFLPFIRDISVGDTANFMSQYSNAGWIVSTTMSTISKESYIYYQGITTQLSANSQLFDPIATQIKGNINCLTDTQLVLGTFEVYSKSVKQRGFFLTSDLSDTINKEITVPGPMKTDTFEKWPAPYWINFY